MAFLILVVVGFGARAWGGAATGPATGEAVQQLEATVSEVAGLVEVRVEETGAWQEAKEGMAVPVEAECRTGPKSSITLTIPPAKVITLDRLGTVKILEAFQKGNKFTTDLGMKYGLVRYHGEGRGLEHELIIRSPTSALVVRGSDVEKMDYSYISVVRVYQGLAERQGGPTKKVVIGSGPTDSYGNRPLEVGKNDLTPAEHALNLAAAPYRRDEVLTPAEQEVAAQVSNVGTTPTGVLSQSVRRRPVPVVQFPTALGSLLFDLHWVGDGASGVAPDLDLVVASPKREKLMAGGSAGSGGVGGPNDQGGPNRASGREFVAWEKSYPLGRYTYGVKYVGTGDPATFKVNVLQNGKTINPEFVDTVHEADRVVTFTVGVASPVANGTAAAKKGLVAGSQRVQRRK